MNHKPYHTRLLCIYFVSLVLGGCSNNGDLSGKGVIAGTLYIKDILNGVPDSSVLAGIPLYIQYAEGSTASYLYATQTGADGKFMFSNLVPGKSYWVFTTLDTFGMQLNVKEKISGGMTNAELTVSPQDSAVNGFIVTLLDPFGSPVGGFPLFLFNSRALADYNDSTGSILRLQTDATGRAYAFNLQPGEYYINANGMVGDLPLQGRDSFPVGLGTDTIQKPVLQMDSAQNGFVVWVEDPLHTPVANCNVFVFNSAVLAEGNDSLGAISELRTDMNGRAHIYNLLKGNYFVNVRDSVGNTILGIQMDTVAVSSNTITTDTILLKKE